MVERANWAPRLQFPKRFWVGYAVLLLSVSFICVTLIQANDARRLNAHNIAVSALILEQRYVAPNSGRNGDGSHFVTYTFTLGDNVLTNERNVPEPFYSAHPVGTVWTIHVHPDAPRIHDLYDGETRKNAWGFLAFSLFIGLAGAILALTSGNLAALRASLR